jgi:phage gp29-like protein
MLLDQLGREVQMSAIKSPDSREISTALIRDRWSTYPSSGLTPQRLADIFKAADQGDVQRQAELFEEMEEKDAHLASQFQTRKLAVQGLPWEVLPASETARDKEIAAFCSETLQGMTHLEDYILDMLDALPKGYSMLEIIWNMSAGQSAIRELKWIHPKKITFWNSMTPRILTEEDQVQGIDPPPFKVVYHRYKARSGYDTRAGILRVCGWMYLFKNYAVKDWFLPL